MRGEVIAIGDEITTGQRLDTNTRWLAERLTGLGVDVLYHTTVGDDLQANVLVFCQAIERADVVVSTGGLGPTADDLTRDALAAAAGVELVQDDASLAHIRALFQSRGRQMPERNALQAMVPAGAKVVPNEHGTAPGVHLAVPRDGRSPCHVFALPGVPAEMHEMWAETVGTTIETLGERRRVIRHRRIKCFGTGESHLEAMLPDLIARGREPRVGITASRTTLTLRVTASGETEQACLAAMDPTIQTIRETLGVLVFGEEDDELQHVVVRTLNERGQTLWVRDAASRGLLVRWLAEADPEGAVLAGGEVTPAEEVDEPSVDAYAQRLREQRGTDFALAAWVTPEPSVIVALAHERGTRVKTYPTAGHPDIANDRAAKLAMNLLRLHLINHD